MFNFRTISYVISQVPGQHKLPASNTRRYKVIKHVVRYTNYKTPLGANDYYYS